MVGPGRSAPHSPVLIGLLLGLWTVVPPVNAQESVLGADTGPVVIEWDAREVSYRVQVRRDGQIFIDTVQAESRLSLDLAPGDYEYNIIVLSPFGKPVTESGWTALKVERSRVPYFRVRPPLTVWEGETGIVLTVESVELRELTEFRLRSGDQSVPAVWSGSGGVYTVRVPDGAAGSGEWDLEALDPSGRAFVHPDALVVRPTRAPEVKKLDTRTVPAEGLVPLVIEGDAFDSEMTVRFEGPGGELPVAALEIRDGRSALVYLDMDNAEPGRYTLVAVNPAGEETRRENILTVTEPVVEEKLKNQPRFDFQIGWTPMWIGVPGKDEDLPAFLVFDVAGIFHSGMIAPFLRSVGIEARATAGVSGPADWSSPEIDFIGSLDLSGYYRPLVSGKVAPVFLLGVGNLWSGYARDEGIENIIFIRTGIGMDITDVRRTTRIGLNLSFGFTGDTFPIVSLMFRRGIRY